MACASLRDNFSKFDSTPAGNLAPAAHQNSLQPFSNKDLREFFLPNPAVEAVMRHSRRQPQHKLPNPLPSAPRIRLERPPIDRKCKYYDNLSTSEPAEAKPGCHPRFLWRQTTKRNTKVKKRTQKAKRKWFWLSIPNIFESDFTESQVGCQAPQRALSRTPQTRDKSFLLKDLYFFPGEALAEPIQTHTGRSGRGQNSRIVPERIDMKLGLVERGV